MTRDEMRDRVLDVLSPWQIRFLGWLGGAVTTSDEAPVEVLVTGALEEADAYARTPGHGPELTESEIHRCISHGLRHLGARCGAMRSPVDRPGLLGPMLVSELVSSWVGVEEGARAFTGGAREPNPPLPIRPPLTKPGGWGSIFEL